MRFVLCRPLKHIPTDPTWMLPTINSCLKHKKLYFTLFVWTIVNSPKCTYSKRLRYMLSTRQKEICVVSAFKTHPYGSHKDAPHNKLVPETQETIFHPLRMDNNQLAEMYIFDINWNLDEALNWNLTIYCIKHCIYTYAFYHLVF